MRFRLVLFFLVSLKANAHPFIVKIVNSHAHHVVLSSESDNQQINIPPKHSREILVNAASDWRVKYSSGAYGLTSWNLNDPLDLYLKDLQAIAWTSFGKRAAGRVLYGELCLSLDKKGFIWNSYKLESCGALINTMVRKTNLAMFLQSVRSMKTITTDLDLLQLKETYPSSLSDVCVDVYNRLLALTEQSVMITKLVFLAAQCRAIAPWPPQAMKISN